MCITLYKINLSLRHDHLDRLASVGSKTGPQGFVARNQIIQCAMQSVLIQFALEFQHYREVIDRVAWLQLIQKP